MMMANGKANMLNMGGSFNAKAQYFSTTNSRSVANSIQGSPAKHKLGGPQGQFMGAVIQPNGSSKP
jgi:hypothetical protein